MDEEIEEMVMEEEAAPSRLTGLYGEIDDDNSKELAGALLSYLHEARKSDEESPPVDMVISTGGGQVADMFAIYDLMRMLREECEIITLGIGKVMSAGILLLAAGTKGKRQIGKHCRIMFHHIIASDGGSLPNIASAYKEAHRMEKMMFEAVATESNLTIKELRRICSKNVDVYFTAEEAVKMGIADIVV